MCMRIFLCACVIVCECVFMTLLECLRHFVIVCGCVCVCVCVCERVSHWVLLPWLYVGVFVMICVCEQVGLCMSWCV